MNLEEAEKEVREACVTAQAYELAKTEAEAFLAKVKADPNNNEGIATNDNRKVSKSNQPLTPLQSLTRDIPTSEYKSLFRYPAETPRLLNGVNNVYVAIVTEFIDADAAFDTDKMGDRIAHSFDHLPKNSRIDSPMPSTVICSQRSWKAQPSAPRFGHGSPLCGRIIVHAKAGGAGRSSGSSYDRLLMISSRYAKTAFATSRRYGRSSDTTPS